jgi:hypothetical protein
MGEVASDVGVAQDSHPDRRVRGPMEWDKTMVAELAVEQGVCVRPLARRLVDRVSGEASTVVLPCGSTRESRCPVCAKRARVLRMHQCAEGWHAADELPDEGLEPTIGDDSEEPDDEITDDGDRSDRVVRSTRRRGDVADLPVRPVETRTVGRSFTARDGKVYRPSMFITLTLPSYGRVVRGEGVPVDPGRYDYRRAALDAMHFSKLVDRWVQNLRRGAGFKVQYFAAIEPQRRLAPHVHVAMRGAIERRVIRQVTRGTYFQLWWPSFDVPLYVHRSPVFLDGIYCDPDTHQELKTWEQALAELDQDTDARPAHVMRLGAQVDVKGILAGSADADRTIGYLTKYLAKSMAAPMGDGQESGSAAAKHQDRLAAEVRWLPCTPGWGTGCGSGSSPRTPVLGCAPGHARPRLTIVSTSGWAGEGSWSAGSGPARRWTCTAPTGPPWSVRSWKKPACRLPRQIGAPPTSWRLTVNHASSGVCCRRGSPAITPRSSPRSSNATPGVPSTTKPNG